MKSVIAGALLGSLAWTAFAQEPPTKGVNFYSLEREVQLGREAAASLERALPMVHAPKLTAYVARLGSELAKQAGSPFGYTFSVYDDRKPAAVQPVAMAMPADAFQGRAGEPVAVAGGFVLVPLSLLAGAPDESTFAFQLAHAMAHIAGRHSTRRATRDEVSRMATSPSKVPKASIAGMQQLLTELGSLSVARRLELEADTVAVRIMAAAGYDPAAAIGYLEGQPAAAEASPSYSAHPTRSQRVEAIRAAAEQLPARAYSASTGGFAEAKALAAAVR